VGNEDLEYDEDDQEVEQDKDTTNPDFLENGSKIVPTDRASRGESSSVDALGNTINIRKLNIHDTG